MGKGYRLIYFSTLSPSVLLRWWLTDRKSTWPAKTCAIYPHSRLSSRTSCSKENRGKKPAKWGLPGKRRWCILFKKFQYLSLNQPVRSPLKTTGSISEQNSKYYDTTCDKTVSQFNLHLRRIHISTDQAAPCINGRSHRVWYGALRAPVDTRAV